MVTVNGSPLDLLLLPSEKEKIRKSRCAKWRVVDINVRLWEYVSWKLFLTCFRVICRPPLPSLQSGHVPGSCERTLLQHFHFPYSPQNILFTQDMTFKNNNADYFKMLPRKETWHLSVEIRAWECLSAPSCLWWLAWRARCLLPPRRDAWSSTRPCCSLVLSENPCLEVDHVEKSWRSRHVTINKTKTWQVCLPADLSWCGWGERCG